MSTARLPHTNSPSESQFRRRFNELSDQVSQSIGSIADGTGDIGTLNAILAPGITGTVTLAKITGGGANGSLTFTKGIITAVTNPT